MAPAIAIKPNKTKLLKVGTVRARIGFSKVPSL
jgi:hypothetical protein